MYTGPHGAVGVRVLEAIHQVEAVLQALARTHDAERSALAASGLHALKSGQAQEEIAHAEQFAEEEATCRP